MHLAVTPKTDQLILGIETSGTTGGAALLCQGNLLAGLHFTSKSLYSQRLLPSIEWMLERAQTDVTSITAVAVSKGPGSFTGLRIGMSVAKALAYANGAALVGVSTLEALALRGATIAQAGVPVCPILDARQGEVYAALFRPIVPSPAPGVPMQMPALERLHEDFAGKIEELAAWIHQPTIFLGEGMLRYQSRLEQLLGDHFLLAPTIRNLPSAEEVAWLGAQRLAHGDADDPVLLEPYYLRHSYTVPKKPTL